MNFSVFQPSADTPGVCCETLCRMKSQKFESELQGINAIAAPPLHFPHRYACAALTHERNNRRNKKNSEQIKDQIQIRGTHGQGHVISHAGWLTSSTAASEFQAQSLPLCPLPKQTASHKRFEPSGNKFLMPSVQPSCVAILDHMIQGSVVGIVSPRKFQAMLAHRFPEILPVRVEAGHGRDK